MLLQNLSFRQNINGIACGVEDNHKIIRQLRCSKPENARYRVKVLGRPTESCCIACTRAWVSDIVFQRHPGFPVCTGRHCDHENNYRLIIPTLWGGLRTLSPPFEILLK